MFLCVRRRRWTTRLWIHTHTHHAVHNNIVKTKGEQTLSVQAGAKELIQHTAAVFNHHHHLSGLCSALLINPIVQSSGLKASSNQTQCTDHSPPYTTPKRSHIIIIVCSLNLFVFYEFGTLNHVYSYGTICVYAIHACLTALLFVYCV